MGRIQLVIIHFQKKKFLTTFRCRSLHLSVQIPRVAIVQTEHKYGHSTAMGAAQRKKHPAKSAKVLFLLAPAVGIEPTTN